MRYMTIWRCRFCLVKRRLLSAVIPVASPITTDLTIRLTISVDQLIAKAGGESERATGFFYVGPTSCDSFRDFTLNPAAYNTHCTSFFYETYGFLTACGYETKRLGIYNFSCLFEERSDRLSEMVEQSIDRRREKGCKCFVFLLLLSFTRVYILCELYFFLCYFSLCEYTV